MYAAATYQSRFSHSAEEALDDGEIELRLRETVRFWREWSARCTYQGEYQDEVLRSALTLKALTYAPSGALVAAATTSLPEVIGGSRNWDYRYTWIRDASFALYALSIIGYTEEARAFKDWLEWSTSGRAGDLQIMYDLDGERRLSEVEIPELDGHRRSRPVRVGTDTGARLCGCVTTSHGTPKTSSKREEVRMHLGEPSATIPLAELRTLGCGATPVPSGLPFSGRVL